MRPFPVSRKIPGSLPPWPPARWSAHGKSTFFWPWEAEASSTWPRPSASEAMQLRISGIITSKGLCLKQPFLPHGGGLAILMPAWRRYMAGSCPAEIAEFARDVWGIAPSKEAEAPKETALAGITRFEDFIRKNGLPATLLEAGITGCDSHRLARLTTAANGPALGGSFRALCVQEIQAVYEIAAGKRV